MASELDRQKVSFEELAYSNMFALNALVDLLDEKGVLQKREILDRVKQLRDEVQARSGRNSLP